ADHLFAVQRIRGDADTDQSARDRTQRGRDAAAPSADIVRVHRVDERAIGARVEARRQSIGVTIEPALRGEAAVVAHRAPEALLELAFAAIAHHRDAPRELEPLVAG